MNYYNITSKDAQYYNCLYCLKHFKPNRFIIKDNQVTVKDSITWYLTDELYESVLDYINDNSFNNSNKPNK